MNKSPVPSQIFTYDNLKAKAQREVERLAIAEKKMDEVNAMDHALNAAFTVYHLLDARYRAKNPDGRISARDLCEHSNNDCLKLLHDIVTFNKHARISKEFYSKNPNVHPVENLNFISTQRGDSISTQAGLDLITEDSGIDVYFEDKLAFHVLKTALMEFN